MLVEFILIHSGGFFGAVALNPDVNRGRRLNMALGLGAFYGLFVAVWSWQFQSWWPVVFFLWLLGSKILDVLLNRRATDELRQRQMGMVAASVLFYLFCVFATLLLPLPRLGLTHRGHYYGVPGSGEWVTHPHIVIAGLVGYFGLLAMAKLRAWDVAFARQARKQEGK